MAPVNPPIENATHNFDEMVKALEVADLHHKTVTEIATLAVEYEAKTITAERFSLRVCDILRSNFSNFVPTK